MSTQEYLVQSSKSEGEHPIKTIIPARFSETRFFLMWIAIIFSGYILGLLLNWFDTLYNKVVYIKCSYEQATHFIIRSKDEVDVVCKTGFKQMNGQLVRSFVFRHLTYIILDGVIQVLQKSFEDLSNQDVTELKPNDSKDEVAALQNLYGPCAIEIPPFNFFSFLFAILISPFQILMYFSIIILLAQELVVFVIALSSSSAAGIIAQYFFLRSSNEELRRLAMLRIKVHVIRNGLEIIDNVQLVPGDHILIQQNMMIPCDCIIIKGEVMVDEASLTGESVPVPKANVPKNLHPFTPTPSITLYEGTKIVQCQENTIAVVANIGYGTQKGQYFRNVLFPKPQSNPFYKYSLKFLIGILIISHIGFFITLYYYKKYGFTDWYIASSYLGMVSWIFPPSIPIAIQIRGALTLARLATNKIIGRSIEKIQIAGKVNVVCFDKTGTLTNLGLDVKGQWIMKEKENKGIMNRIMATCHHITRVESDLFGDIVDVEMFKESKWDIDFGCKDCRFQVQNQSQKLKVHTIFDFDSALAMMSVVAEDTESGKYYVYSKGAPEQIFKKCLETTQESISILNELSLQGFRVLALAYKETQGFQLERQQQEKDMNFIGFLYFENKLKSDTPEVIQKLRKANLLLKVISGDNPLTTIECARKAGIIKQEDNNKPIVVFDKIDEQEFKITNLYQGKLQDTVYQWTEFEAQAIQILSLASNISLTGQLLQYLQQNTLSEERDYNKQPRSPGTELASLNQTVGSQVIPLNLLNRLIYNTTVFARMKPEQKCEIVKNLQDQDNIVAMIGDGANDCAAISQAHVGVSFCSSDASYTAPFASQDNSIECLITILKEGRQNTITITIIFMYLVSSFLIQNMCRFILVAETQGIGDIQTIYLIFFEQIPILFLIGWSQPAKDLADMVPMDNIYLLPNQITFYFHNFIVLLTELILAVYIINHPSHDFEAPEPPLTIYLQEGQLNTAIYPIIVISNATLLYCIYQTHPFQVKIIHTPFMLIWFIAHWTYGFLLIFMEQEWIHILKQDTQIENCQFVVLGFVLVSNGLMFAGQPIIDHFFPRTHKIMQRTIQTQA